MSSLDNTKECTYQYYLIYHFQNSKWLAIKEFFKHIFGYNFSTLILRITAKLLRSSNCKSLFLWPFSGIVLVGRTLPCTGWTGILFYSRT